MLMKKKQPNGLSVTILPVTSELRDVPLFRIQVNPSETNGLRKPSQVMIDKPQSVAREKLAMCLGIWMIKPCLLSVVR